MPVPALVLDLFQLADVAPNENCAGSSERGRGSQRMSQNARRAGGTHSVGVVDAVLPASAERITVMAFRLRWLGCCAHVHVAMNSSRSQMLGQRGGQDQPGIGHRVIVIEDDRDRL